MDNLHGFYFTSNGSKFHVRPIQPSDKELVQKGFQELSIKSKYLRFFALRSKLNNTQLNYFTEVDGVNHIAWGILEISNGNPKPVGIGRIVKLKDQPNTAEVAITVVDSYQKKGMGRILFAVLNIVAAHAGIEQLKYCVLSENYFVLEVLKRFGILKKVTEGHIMTVNTKVLTEGTVHSEFPEIKKFLHTMKKAEEKMMKNVDDKDKTKE
jgi:hypothetical protein